MKSPSTTAAPSTSLIVLCICLASVNALNCTLSLPRLLLGDQYGNPQSNQTALIMFDTADICSNATLLPLDGSDFTFRYRDAVAQVVDEYLDHNNKTETRQFVQYEKFSIVFEINAKIGVTYKVGFQGDVNDETTVSTLSYSFKLPVMTPQKAPATQPKILFYGDQDLTTRGFTTIQYLTDNAQTFDFDAFIFLGDYAYEFWQDNGLKGDNFTSYFAPLSWSFPLVMTPGNHENNLNFTLFNEKFQMPGFNLTNLNNYNSFNLGNIHFIHVNLDFYLLNGEIERTQMINWLIADIQAVNRSVYPWVIAVGHKLINCYNPLQKHNKDCVEYITDYEQFDEIFATYGVDMFITGHEHFNQIMAPMYNKTIQNYSYNSTSGDLSYTNGGYLSVIQGNGGCASSPNSTVRMLGIPETLQEASIYMNQRNVGFGWIQAVNDTHLDYHTWDSEGQVEIKQFTIYTNHTIISTAVDPTPTPSPTPSPTITSASRLVVTILFAMIALLA